MRHAVRARQEHRDPGQTGSGADVVRVNGLFGSGMGGVSPLHDSSTDLSGDRTPTKTHLALCGSLVLRGRLGKASSKTDSPCWIVIKVCQISRCISIQDVWTYLSAVCI